MKIKFGTTPYNEVRTMVLGIIVAAVFNCFNHQISLILDKSHDELMQLSMLNVTSTKIKSYCGFSYDDCLCSVQSTKNIVTKHCLTNHFLLGIRIFPLVFFILQIFVIRDLFTLIGKYRRLLIYILSIITVFVFIAIIYGIHQDSCTYSRISIGLHFTAGCVILFSAWESFRIKDRVRSLPNDRKAFNGKDILNGQPAEPIIDDDVFIFWLDLL